MKKAEKIENFIRSVFEVYGLNYGEYFSDWTADDEQVEIPMVRDGQLDLELVHRAAEILGEDVDDLLSMNSKKAAKWQNRFPYITLKNFFEYACKRNYFASNHDSLRLTEVIWNIEIPHKPMRFDYSDITGRMKDLLKEYDRSLPGTYHEGASCRHLKITTASLCHFPELEQMMASFFEMVERSGALFFKALEQELRPEEIREYNIIVSVLGIQDRCIPGKGNLHYSILRRLAPVYLAEQHTDFFDYVRLDPSGDIAPWRCAEFIRNRDLVQAYANIVPETKKALREFAWLTTRFHCSFLWSDAAEDADWSSIYVPKTEAELGEDGEFADMMIRLSGPAARGGLSVPARSGEIPLDIPRMAARIHALGGRRNG